MPVYTYLSESEMTAGRYLTDPEDRNLNDLLQEIRSLTNEEWIIQKHTFRVKPKWYKFEKSYELKTYTLYWYTGLGLECQVINLETQSGMSSVFNYSYKNNISNYLMGMINGIQHCKEKNIGKI